MACFFSSPWPDPNSPVLSKIDFGVPLVEMLKWLEVRDTFLGDNRKKQDITAALNLARDCKHPDAVWLVSVCNGKDVSTKWQLESVFLSFGNDDARALFFAWWFNENGWEDLTLLRRSAEMGNALACSKLCEQVFGGNQEKAFQLAQLAASQRERNGFFEFADCLRLGLGREPDLSLTTENLSLTKENYLVAAELGHMRAAEWLGRFEESESVRWLWWSRAAVGGSPLDFFGSFLIEVRQFFSGSGNASVLFLIGRALKGNIDLEKRRIFGDFFSFDSFIGPANQAVSFYDSQINSARLAVDMWTLIATRLHLIKDMRILIGKMIWEARFEATYKI